MPGQPVLSRRGWAGVILLAAVAAVLLRWGPDRLTAWRADRTAERFVSAFHRADSAALAGLTPSGNPAGILCARRTWPEAYWSRRGAVPPVELVGTGLDRHYRVVGDTLPERVGPAVFDFFIVADKPGLVDRYFSDLRGVPWAERFRGCLQGG